MSRPNRPTRPQYRKADATRKARPSRPRIGRLKWPSGSIDAERSIKFWIKKDIQLASEIKNNELERIIKKIPLGISMYRTTVWSELEAAVRIAIKREERNIRNIIPSNSGTLADNVYKTIKNIKIEWFKKCKVYVGAPNIDYAKKVNAYSSSDTQIQHRKGWQMSGGMRSRSQKYWYNAGMGDPNAEYHFFDILMEYVHDFIIDAVLRAIRKSSLTGLPEFFHEYIQWN